MNTIHEVNEMNQGTTILTLNNGYHLFSRKVGEGPIKLLCVHGGPGGTHEGFENFAPYLNDMGVEVYMYDQLGSYHSDQPDFSKEENRHFLTLDYYLGELEEVRQKMGLENFYLLGHSWGGLLAQEYALKYGQHLKGLVLMSMIDNIEEYAPHVNKLREDLFSDLEVQYMRDVEEEENFDDPMYQHLVRKLYSLYVTRHPKLKHMVSLNAATVYNHFQGNNEFVMVGTLNGWDRRADLHKIETPTLLTFGEVDTMPLDSARRMQNTLPHSRLVITPDGGHCHNVDNPDAFFKSLSKFLQDVEDGTFQGA